MYRKIIFSKLSLYKIMFYYTQSILSQYKLIDKHLYSSQMRMYFAINYAVSKEVCFNFMPDTWLSISQG